MACTTNADCTDPTYNQCQDIMMSMICTKTCGSGSDCPNPPTDGTCNNNGYCK